ncbi:hypothetical protein [Mesorhizobium marinum]|uniref:hypothetical protein n=1 Tax=Mesorhizobium marinum TaxID=3228790 RepID=UPI00346781BF
MHEWVLAPLLLAIGMFGSVLPDMGYFSMVPGDIGDPRFNSVVLEHLFRLATGQQNALWSPDFFFPFGGVLAFSDNHLGSGAVYVAARLLGAMREHAFDVWYLTGFILNFLAALYALNRFGLSPAASAIGAFLFTFAIPALAQNGHAQLVYRFAVPLAVLALWQLFTRRRAMDAVTVIVWTVWQFYCSIYVGIFLFYLLAAMTAVLVRQERSVPLRPWLESLSRETAATKALGAAVGVAALAALAYLVGNYFAVSRLYDLGRDVEQITPMLPRWASYIVADVSPWLDGVARSIPMPVRHEHQMFVGFGAVALAAAGILGAWRQPGSRIGKTMMWSLLLLMIGTLWIKHFSFYYLIAWLPGINAVRAVTRIIVVMLLPISVLAGLGVDYLRRAVGRTAMADVAVVLASAALVVLEPLNVPPRSDPIAMWQERQAALKAILPTDLPPDAIIWVRTGSDVRVDMVHAELDAMILAQDIGRPTLNGYSGNQPPGNIGSDSCDSVEDKLRGYADFMGGIDVSDYVKRVVTLDLSPCGKAQ